MIQAEHEYLCVVLLDMFYFHYYLGKIPILTNIFEMGWNHQLDLGGGLPTHYGSVEKWYIYLHENHKNQPKWKQTYTIHGSLGICFIFSSRSLGKWSNLTNICQMGWNHQQGIPWQSCSCPTNGPLVHHGFGMLVLLQGFGSWNSDVLKKMRQHYQGALVVGRGFACWCWRFVGQAILTLTFWQKWILCGGLWKQPPAFLEQMLVLFGILLEQVRWCNLWRLLIYYRFFSLRKSCDFWDKSPFLYIWHIFLFCIPSLVVYSYGSMMLVDLTMELLFWPFCFRFLWCFSWPFYLKD